MSESTLALTSSLLQSAGFAHAFTLRGAQDPLEAVAAQLGFSLDVLHQATQVHGPRAVHAKGDREATRREEADAVIAAAPYAAAVRVADCVPVLVGDIASGAVAAVHAGWRGTVAGVIAAAIRELPAGRKVAAIGPCIGPCCFEVGADVGAQIADGCNEPRAISRRAGEKSYVDLRLGVRALLRASGLADADVDDVPGCTRCDAVRFYSYRRDGANAGRHHAIIHSRALSV